MQTKGLCHAMHTRASIRLTSQLPLYRIKFAGHLHISYPLAYTVQSTGGSLLTVCTSFSIRWQRILTKYRAITPITKAYHVGCQQVSRVETYFTSQILAFYIYYTSTVHFHALYKIPYIFVETNLCNGATAPSAAGRCLGENEFD